ncbi:MAG: hypothetical protein GX639_13685 [Fibrobacter sp.]|nr:hypothetical protein [Fibrobacter sp.]
MIIFRKYELNSGLLRRLLTASVLCAVSQLYAQDFRSASSGVNQLSYQILQPRSSADVKSVPSVDPAIYILGSGDVIEIRSSKTPWNVYSGTVNEAGGLFIPGLGKFDVGNKPFETARKEITGFLLQQNPKDEIDITLSVPKQVEVIVTGDAVKSGSFRLNGALRILDALKIAIKDSMSLFSDIHYRNVSVTLRGKTTYYDLSGFISNGVGTENPYLFSGAIISVSPPTKWLTISGAISSPFPESIPVREDDTYGAIFKLFKLTEYADTTNILIYRSGIQVTRYTLSQLSGEKAKDLDYVVIGSNKPPKQLIQVSIKGEVKNPGTYPLATGSVFSAREVISVSGGVTENGDSSRVYIIRKDPLGNLSNRIGKEFGDQPLRKDPLNQRMIASGDYRIIPLRTASVALANDDVIIVPEVSKTVFVSGNVRKPGAYQYAKGESMKYYIKLAGGATKKADRKNCSIVTAYSDYWVVKTTPDIEAGDLILVPNRPQNERLRNYEIVIRSIYYIATTISVGIALGRTLDLIEDND